MSNPTVVSKSVTQTLQICEYINSLDNYSPMKFIATFLSSNHEDLVYRRCLIKAGLGTQQTKSIFKNLARLTLASDAGESEWHKWILDEASAIVNAQELPRGHFPAGAYVSSSHINPDHFSESAEAARARQVRTGMPFLHSLIQRKVSLGMKKKDLTAYQDDETSDSPPLAPELPRAGMAVKPGSTEIEGALDDESVLAMENLVYVKSTPAEQSAHKVETVSRPQSRDNPSVSRGHAYSCLTNATLLLPLLCYDNIDIHLRIHNTRIDTSSRLFHGTWGFFKVIEACVIAQSQDEAVSLATFLQSMASAQQKAVEMSAFSPSPAQSDHWVSVIKLQLAKAFTDYVEHLPGAPPRELLPRLDTKPPAIDRIAMHKANVHFLRMMNAPDNSADGISRVLDEIKAQINMDADSLARNLLVAGGDVGSNLLLESLRTKRYPAIDDVEGLQWVLSVFGGAHTTWNVAKTLWGLHWGCSDKGEDTGVWRSVFSLGGDHKKPVAAQDFNLIMRSVQQVDPSKITYDAVHGARQVIGSMGEIDLSQEANVKKVLDEAWTQYFDATAIKEGHGTNIERLTYRLSNNIPLLRRLMQLLKALAGHKVIYQPNLCTITPASMKLFLQYAEECLVEKSGARPLAQVANSWTAGQRKMIKLLRDDRDSGRSSRFRWGSPDLLDSGRDENEENNMEDW
ncbi:uncharacterized protein MELLADRAFT_59724 [Melampsora larici-populina 98AG31]|uniref:DUF6589 domain-containing protein n=1 Tax=Melampsora larici-populina (strain 98AG31 / pathotype 3-4-7) TaxID=747676 RepID=F4R724_MELLP|nr:uncharacterized protein MELLADRAFT_59724 [Melampsora larici-populina 98AG31]EGG11504.1 hypothetical protein MELLADRAFT_59724 [Melampsora larici-populina 98AG31]